MSSSTTIPPTICQSCIRLLATSNTPSCDASPTQPTCTKCALLKHTCKPVPTELNLQLTDLIHFHSRWRRALDGGDKDVASKAKGGLTTRIMDLIDDLEDVEAKPAGSGHSAGGGNGNVSSVPVTPPQTPVIGRKQVKEGAGVGGKKGGGVVKKPAVPRAAKPNVQAQTKAKLEKVLGSSSSKKSKSGSHTPPSNADVVRASNVVTAANETVGLGLDMTSHPPLFGTVTPGHVTHVHDSSYNMPPPALSPPFGHANTFDDAHLDPSNISNFLDFNSLDSSSSNDYPALMAPPSTPMATFQHGNVNMQGPGGGAGLNFNNDVGMQILQQLQTLNTTMSGMYEMMRRQGGS